MVEKECSLEVDILQRRKCRETEKDERRRTNRIREESVGREGESERRRKVCWVDSVAVEC
jgi:hypothetical protein